MVAMVSLYQNMVFPEDLTDGEYSDYLDTYLSEVETEEDRNSGDEFYDTRSVHLSEDEEEDEEEEDVLDKIQDPDKMDFILPARKLPSVKEMDEEYDVLLYSLFIIPLLSVVDSIVRLQSVLKTKHETEKRNERFIKLQKEELEAWEGKKIISRLGPIIQQKTLNDRYIEMIEKKKEIESNRLEKESTQRRKKNLELQNIKFRTEGKARAVKKQGMNKNTTAHKAKANFSLDFKERKTVAESFINKTANIKEAGTGKRATRKIRQQKEQEEQKKIDERFAKNLVEIAKAKEEKVEVEKVEKVEVEKTEEELEKELEKELEEKELVDIINHHKDIIQKHEHIQQVRKEKKQEKKEQKEEDDDFVTQMLKNRKQLLITSSKPKVVVNKSTPKPTKVTIQVGVGIISQARQRRCINDVVYAERTDGFNIISDPEKQKDELKFTSLCRSVLTGKKCYHTSCRFAHTIEQLQTRPCKFGQGCRFVRCVNDGLYTNINPKNPCSFFHPNETTEQMHARLGVPKKTTPVISKTVIVTPTIIPISSKKTWASLSSSKAIHIMKNFGAEESKGLGKNLQGDIETVYSKIILRSSNDKSGLQESSEQIKTPAWSKPISWVSGGLVQTPEKPKRNNRWDEVDNKVMMTFDKVYTEIKKINNKVISLEKNQSPTPSPKPSPTPPTSSPKPSPKKTKEKKPKRNNRWDEVDNKVMMTFDKVYTEIKKINTKVISLEKNQSPTPSPKPPTSSPKPSPTPPTSSPKPSPTPPTSSPKPSPKKTKEKKTKEKKTKEKKTKEKKTKSKPVIFKVPRDKAEEATKRIIESGIYNFQILIID
jgi:hypothetical protein